MENGPASAEEVRIAEVDSETFLDVHCFETSIIDTVDNCS